MWAAEVTPDAEGAWTFEVEAWSDPVATWRHDAEIKIPAGIDVELMFTEGALLLERAAAGLPQAPTRAARCSPTRSRRCATPPVPSAAALAAGVSPAVDAVLAAHPLRDLVTARGPLPVLRRPGARALRLLVRVLPALRGRLRRRRRRGRLRHLPDRRQAARRASPRWASTSSTCRRSTRSARSTARAPTTPCTPVRDDVGSPWAIGSDEGGHDAVHPDLGTLDDFDAFVARADALGLEVALDLALQAAPDHPWVTDAPGVVHHPRRRHDRLRREPAEEVPGHLPDQLRQRPRTASTPRCCASSGTGWRTACGSSASTTRTPSR